MKTKINNRLLVIIISGLLLVLAYYFGLYSPLQANIAEAKNQTKTLNDRYNQLLILNAKREKYLNDIEIMEDKIREIDKKFPGEMTQELAIKTMTDLENKVGVEFEAVNFGMTQVMTRDSDLFESNDSNAEKTTSDRMEAYKLGMSTRLNLTYENMLAILDEIKKYPNRISIDNAEMVYIMEKDELSTDLTINLFAFKAPNVDYKLYKEEGILRSKQNIFENFIDLIRGEAYPKRREKDLLDKQEDFIISLEPIKSDITTVIVGRAGKGMDESKIYADNKGSEPITFNFSQKAGKYTYSYSTSKSRYPKTGVGQFNPGKSIEIKVYSKTRHSATDLAGASVTVNNSTDKNVYITYFSEDKANPRFKLVKSTGPVKILK